MAINLAPLLLKLSPVGALLKRVPWWIWAGIAALVAYGLFSSWHEGQKKQLVTESYFAGHKAALEEVNRQAAQLKADALKLQAAAEKLQTVANEEVRIEYARDVATADARADRLRRGPAPQCPAGAGSSDLPAVSGGAGGQAPAGRDADARVAGIPWGPVVTFAHRCDLDRAALTAWEDWYDKQRAIWFEWQAKAAKAAREARGEP